MHTPDHKQNFPLAIFLPGFKGFKDWGYFPLLAEVFNKEGIALVTVNFSHNGVNPANPEEFSDLEAFGNNTISQELKEIKSIVEWAIANAGMYGWDPGNICLIGHSRGGGEAIVFASTDDRINKVITWAPVSDFGFSFKNANHEKWKQEGKIFIENTRTKQQMPVNYSFWEDLEKNKEAFNIIKAAAAIEMPMMLLHGDADESVPIVHSEKIYEQCLHSVFIGIENGTHTFNAGHPWPVGSKFPYQLQEALVNTIEFIKD